MSTFWHGAYEVARKEVLQHVRTKRLFIIGGLLIASLAFITLFVGPRFLANQEDIGGTSLENFVFLIYFSTLFVGGYFFIQLLAIVLTADAVCSEWSSRTIFLLLSKPVSRMSFLIGKFAGSVLTIAMTILVLFSLDYLVMQPFYDGSPSANEVGRFFGAVGILILGAAAFASVALFFSTLSRSTVVSLLLTLAMWIIVFPLITNLGLFTTIGDRDFDGDFDSPRIDWSRYLSPGAAMSIAGEILVKDDSTRAAFEFLSGTPAHMSWAIVALVAHTVIWFGLSLLIVQRRNFE